LPALAPLAVLTGPHLARAWETKWRKPLIVLLLIVPLFCSALMGYFSLNNTAIRTEKWAMQAYEASAVNLPGPLTYVDSKPSYSAHFYNDTPPQHMTALIFKAWLAQSTPVGTHYFSIRTVDFKTYALPPDTKILYTGRHFTLVRIS
jgi:hypothetical protein